jgi:hypothetical protein
MMGSCPETRTELVQEDPVFRYIIPALSLLVAGCTNLEPVHEDSPKTVPVPDPTDVDDDGDGATEKGGDCDDLDPLLNVRDQDGDGFSTCEDDCDDLDPNASPWDPDYDGYSSCSALPDCDQGNAHTYPGAAEYDSATDCMRDEDGDGYGANANLGPFVTLGTDCDDSDPELNAADLDGDGLTTCDGDIDDSDPDVGLCSFPVELATGDVVNLPNEVQLTLSASSPSGAKVPGVQEVLRFNLSVVHPECPDITFTGGRLRFNWTINGITVWEPADVTMYNLSTDGLAASIWGPEPLLVAYAYPEVAEIIPAGATHTFSVYADLSQASAANDDSVSVNFESNSLVVEIDGVEYWLLHDPVTGGTLIF